MGYFAAARLGEHPRRNHRYPWMVARGILAQIWLKMRIQNLNSLKVLFSLEGVQAAGE